ncbi:MAG: hypothetical protein ACUVRM_01790 [Bacillota bacterium]
MESIRRAMPSLLGDKRRLIEFKGIFGVTRIPFAEESKHIKAVLDIPEDYEVACYLALGYPDKKAKLPKQHIIKVEERMHFNKW